LFAQRAIRAGLRRETIIGLAITIAYGVLFMNFQYFEYTHAPFNINDSVYGSIFYMLTGLHGMHVLFGIGFIVVALIRHIRYHLMVENHLNLDFAA
jgi:heme/copper-type cytochrome/quinol oxidase subunit 3